MMTGIIILAGGENTRMGENKALLQLGSKPLISHMIEKLSTISDKIYLVTSTPEEYSFLENINFVPDLLPENKSILEAIYSGLSASQEQDNFICACDMPYLNIPLINYLFSLKSQFDIVIPAIDYKPVLLHTIYSKTCLPVIEKSLEKGNKKVKKIFRDLNVKYVPQQALESEDPKLMSFFHVKTFLDYILAQTDFN